MECPSIAIIYVYLKHKCMTYVTLGIVKKSELTTSVGYTISLHSQLLSGTKNAN